MLHTTKGIVLHHFKYAEKSVIAKIYTQKFGLQSYLINGVRNKKSKNKLAYLQALSIVEINAYHKTSKTLQQLKNIKLHIPFQSIPFNIYKSSISFFIAEVLLKSIKEEEPNENLFHFLIHAVQILDLQHNNYNNFHLIFLAQLAKHLGFYPQKIQIDTTKTLFFDLQEGVFTHQTPHHQAFVLGQKASSFFTTLGTNFDAMSSLTINTKQRKILLNVFLDFYALQLANFGALKSKSILEEILN